MERKVSNTTPVQIKAPFLQIGFRERAEAVGTESSGEVVIEEAEIHSHQVFLRVCVV